ncbi:hypothetical protein CRG98_032494 [Punica granatum]|uniref:Uncharacterized protein n=1 Tax=Punica granatum TaxID=22663 RepID=A0A2I0ISU9_PUNGR|nr:hypothetical protein CRG98_032494 [Punica granatum]
MGPTLSAFVFFTIRTLILINSMSLDQSDRIKMIYRRYNSFTLSGSIPLVCGAHLSLGRGPLYNLAVIKPAAVRKENSGGPQRPLPKTLRPTPPHMYGPDSIGRGACFDLVPSLLWSNPPVLLTRVRLIVVP